VFITFEGIEGCGKSTQAKRLALRLDDLGVPLVLTHEPGGTSVGEGIRRILLDSRNRHLSALAELLLYGADRAQHVTEVIKPALEQGKWVLCDRFYDATTVYQGYARGLDMAFVLSMNQKASQGLRPHRTILIDCPVEVGLGRALARNERLLQDEQDRFEREKREFHEAVRKGYLDMAEKEKGRFVVVNGTTGEDELEGIIFDQLKPMIP